MRNCGVPRDLILQIRHTSKVSIVRDSVSPDRIHMLEASSPQLSLSNLVLYIKSRSSRRLQVEFQYLRKR
jgi:putative transposase